MATTITAISASAFRLAPVSMSRATGPAKRSPWPQPKRDRKGEERRDRKKRRVQNWYDNLLAKKDRLEDQRNRQLSSIRDSIGDIANKEWDVLTESCRDNDNDSDSSDEDGFDIEEDVADEVDDLTKRTEKLPGTKKH